MTNRGTLLVAWQELDAEEVPAVWLARSQDGGATFESPRRLSGPHPAHRPAIATDGRMVWLVWERSTESGGSRIMLRASTGDGRQWEPPMPLDRTAVPRATQRYATVVPAGAGSADVVFEDDRAGDADVLVVPVRGRRPVEPPRRVDHGPADTHARVPDAIRMPDGRLLVARQDTRNGVERIALASSGSERRQP